VARTSPNGDIVEIGFPFEVRKVTGDPKVTDVKGKMAVERGPIVYCAEWPDVAGGTVLETLFDARADLKPSVAKDFYGGVTVIDTEARSITNPSLPAKPARLIPYYLWSNRGAGEMTVWLSTKEYALGDIGPAGGWIFYENPHYATEGWRYLEAAPFDQSGGAKWGCFRTAIPGARGSVVGTGNQNTTDMLAGCTEPGDAASLCAALSVNGVRGWYLPSREELGLMYRNLKAAGLGDFRDGGLTENFNYWTSTQSTADMAAHIDFADFGRNHSDDKDFPRRVRAIRTI
jgi:Beta-L-arabinofuranosidase, GH127